MKYAIVNSANIVENICIWDGVTEWLPCHYDDNVVLVEDLEVGIGWTMNQDGTFSSPQVDEASV